MLRRFATVLALALLTSGCAGMSNLKKRAAFDMQCPQDQLVVTELGNTTYGVEGCGQRGTYVCKQDTARGCDDWILNSDTEDQ
jgi:hypothetical protein